MPPLWSVSGFPDLVIELVVSSSPESPSPRSRFVTIAACTSRWPPWPNLSVRACTPLDSSKPDDTFAQLRCGDQDRQVHTGARTTTSTMMRVQVPSSWFSPSTTTPGALGSIKSNNDCVQLPATPNIYGLCTTTSTTAVYHYFHYRRENVYFLYIAPNSFCPRMHASKV